MANKKYGGERALVGYPTATAFHVGSVVDVIPDTSANVNRFSGPAWVTAVEGSGVDERYDVKYIPGCGIGVGEVKKLDRRALAHRAAPPDRRKRRGSTSGTTPGGDNSSGNGGGGESEDEGWERRYHEQQRAWAQERKMLEEQHAQQLANMDMANRDLRDRHTELHQKLVDQSAASTAAANESKQLQKDLDQARNEHIAKQAQVRGW